MNALMNPGDPTASSIIMKLKAYIGKTEREGVGMRIVEYLLHP